MTHPWSLLNASAKTSLKVSLRRPGLLAALVAVASAGVVLGRGFSFPAQALSVSLNGEVLATAYLCMGWIIGLAVGPHLVQRAEPPFPGALPQQAFPRNTAWASLGSLLGCAGALALSLLAVTALICATRPDLRTQPALLARAAWLGWLGGVALLTWCLLLGRWLPRPLLMAMSLVLLLLTLSPGGLPDSPVTAGFALFVFPVSPASLSSEEWLGNGFWLVSARGALHCIGLALFLFLTATPAKRLQTTS